MTLSFVYPPGFDGDETWPHPEDDILGALRAVREHSTGVVVPLTEEAVVLAGIVNDERRQGGLCEASAIACVDRRYQRVLLGADLSPESVFLPYKTPLVAKARSSVLSQGVGVLKHAFSSELKKLLPDIGDGLVLEKYIEGPQYEINAVVGRLGTVLHTFPLLEQEWDPSEGKILSYAPSKVLEFPGEFAQRVVNRLWLRSCGVNIEFRFENGRPVVIEVQARVGESGPRYTKQTGEMIPVLKQVLREDYVRGEAFSQT